MSLLGGKNNGVFESQLNPLGRSSSFSGTSSGGLLFGNKDASKNGSVSQQSGSLFGNSSSNNATSGGLFGNSTSQNTNVGLQGGLFGSSNNNSINNGNLTLGFGSNNDSKSPTGLFGSVSQPQNTTSGLFGNNSSIANTNSGGLFGTSNASNNQNKGGLFGNSDSTNSQPSTGGLFGNSSSNQTVTGGLFGSSNPTNNQGGGGGLFGNTNIGTNTSEGLFGTSNTSNHQLNGGGIFGSNNKQVPALGLFNSEGSTTVGSNGPSIFGRTNQSLSSNIQQGNSGNQINLNTEDPYSFNSLFSAYKGNVDKMPSSITENIDLYYDDNSNQNTTKRLAGIDKDTQGNKKSKSQLLSKLAQAFSYFTGSKIESKNVPKKGIFSQTNSWDSDRKKLSSKPSSLVPKSVSGKSSKPQIESQNTAGIKRLIVKSKPLKYHLLDTNKVFRARKRRIIGSDDVNKHRKALPTSLSSDESDVDDIESKKVNFDTKFPYRTEKTSLEDIEPPHKNSDVFEGKSVLADDSDENLDNKANNNGYWCTPNIWELSQLKEDEIKNVENFIVGRVGHGQVAFNQPVDLSQLVHQAQSKGRTLNRELFEETVSIRHKVLEIYRDERLKPPIGFGLNVPATITLEKITPKKGFSSRSFIKFLQGQIGMEFVTYDPVTFIWVFKVKHFSIWGLIDDVNECEESSASTKRKLDNNNPLQEPTYTRLYDDEAMSKEYKKQKLSNETKDFPGGWEYIQSSNSPLNTKRGLVANEVENQIESFKNEITASELGANLSDITIESSDSEEIGGSPTYQLTHKSDENRVDYLKQFLSILPPGTNMNDIIDEKVYEPKIMNEALFDKIQVRPNLAVSNDWLIQLELSNDINSSLSPYLFQIDDKKKEFTIKDVDDAFFGEFNRDTEKLNVLKEEGFGKKEHLSVDWYDESNLKSIVTSIDNLLTKSDITIRENDYPRVEQANNINFRDFLVSKLEHEECLIIELASALFDNTEEENTDVEEDLGIHLRNLERKSSFLKWLRRYNEPSVRELTVNQKELLDSVFVSLCGGTIKGAIVSALNNNSPHLAAILTLVDSNDAASKNAARRQLASWSNSSITDKIPDAVVKVFQIIAGDFESILSEVPWNLALLLKLEYGSDDLQLQDVLDSLQYRFDTDLVGEILNIYSISKRTGLKEAIEFTNSSKLNIKLKWYFNKVLAGKEGRIKDRISQSFGEFLGEEGLWREAIFVFSHISSDTNTEKLIRDIVILNIDNVDGEGMEADECTFLSNALLVPKSLLFEATALKKHSLSLFWGECDAYISAGLWEKAHKVITNKLGPETIVSNTPTTNERLASILISFPERGLIVPDWNYGAGIYDGWIKLQEDEDNLETLRFLLANLPIAKYEESPLTEAALTIISRRVADLVLRNHKSFSSFKGKIFALHLGENERNYFENRLKTIQT